jgi:hypothetical protein
MARTHEPDELPEEWQTPLPMRSPVPLLIGLVAVQVLVAALLVLFAVSGASRVKPNTPAYYNR